MPTNPFDSSTWLLVLNPVSGRGVGLRDRSRIEAALESVGIHFRSVVSEYHRHTILLVAEAIGNGCRRILVAGGDGSLNEAVNGIFQQVAVPPGEFRIALLPVGTGNDWARAHGLPHDYGQAAHVIAAGTTQAQDVGLIDLEGTHSKRWFVNVAGMGFDAGVIQRMPNRRLGRLAYLIGLLRELYDYRPLPLTWQLGATEQRADAFVLFACIGRFCGGGMLVAPGASFRDGRFHMVLIRHMGRLSVLRALPQLFDGTLADHPKVETWLTERIRFDAPPGTSIEADGELVGTAPATFTVLPEALRLVVPGGDLH